MVAPYSHAVEVDGWIFVTGQMPINANGGIPEGIEAQTITVFENLKAVLGRLDSDLREVVAFLKTKKRNFRTLWQVRINAAARPLGITYSRLIEGLKAAQVSLDRKVLSDLAATDAIAFGELVKLAQNALVQKAKAA